MERLSARRRKRVSLTCPIEEEPPRLEVRLTQDLKEEALGSMERWSARHRKRASSTWKPIVPRGPSPSRLVTPHRTGYLDPTFLADELLDAPAASQSGSLHRIEHHLKKLSGCGKDSTAESFLKRRTPQQVLYEITGIRSVPVRPRHRAVYGPRAPRVLHRNITPLIPPPPIELLERRASMLSKDSEGDNMCRAANIWNCHRCGTINPPTDNLLLRLPAIRCSLCRELNPTAWNWSMIGCVVNDIRIDTYIYQQGPYGTCTAHAVIVAMDAQRTIGGALHRHTVYQRLAVGSLLWRYLDEFGIPLGAEMNSTMQRLMLENLLRCAQADGVFYEQAWLTPAQSRPTVVPRTLRIGSIFMVPAEDTDYIIRLLAAGHALVTGVTTGRCFRFLAGGQIYCAPECQGNHAITLLGHGVGMRPEVLRDNTPLLSTLKDRSSFRDRSSPPGPMIYFNARNTHGDHAHPDVALEGNGGDFSVWSDQIDVVVWGFYLADN
ncbi:hypothetical protein ACQ4PT_002998 [Festuca glaucescens]